MTPDNASEWIVLVLVALYFAWAGSKSGARTTLQSLYLTGMLNVEEFRRHASDEKMDKMLGKGWRNDDH